MPITLGKDCTISGGGLSNALVRDVVISRQAKEVEFHEIGTNDVYVWNCGYSDVIEVELLVDGGFGEIATGDTVTISAADAGGTFVIVGVQRSEPLNGAVSYRVQFKRSR